MQNVKKGDILYHRETGRPSAVKSVRKLLVGSKLEQRRVALTCGDWFRLSGDRPESAQWTDTQTPELARAWAKELERVAANRVEFEQRLELKRLARLANRDRLNAEPHITIPTYEGDEARITLSYVEQDRAGEIVARTMHYGASVYQQHVRRVGEDGEQDYKLEWLVNWSALGSQSTAIARAYAHAILAAADLADERNAIPTEVCTDAE